MVDKLIYGIIYFFSKLPFSVLYALSSFIAFLLNHVIGYRKEVILDNLRKSFPEKSEKEINDIRIQFNKNFADQLVETLKMFTMSSKELEKRLFYENPEVISKYKGKRSVMIATAHFGNWEYIAGLPLVLPGFDRYAVVYAPIENKFLNDKIVQTREKFGLELLAKNVTFRKIFEYTEKSIIYGFIYDQSPHKSRVRYDLKFLNQITPVHTGTEDIAKMKDAVVVIMDIFRVKRGYYNVTLELLTETPKETEKYEITNKLFSHLEGQIKKDPAQWLWSHRRWKYQPGRDYNLEENRAK